MERDLWIVVYATHPEVAGTFFHDQAQALTDPALRQLYLAYDRAHDLDPADPFLTELADRIVAASIDRYGTDLPGAARRHRRSPSSSRPPSTPPHRPGSASTP